MTVTGSIQPLQGWEQSYLPIVAGDAPDGTVSLRALSEPDIFARLVPLVAANLAVDQRQSVLTIVHYAIGVITETLIAPLALDGVTITATADQLGIVLNEKGSLNAVWIDRDIHITPEISAVRLGACLLNLLDPIAVAAQVIGHFGKRGISLVMFDAIDRGCQRLERAYPIKPESGWIKELLDAIGDTQRKVPRTFTVHPDDGPPVEMTIPRVCCVLARHSTPHACPTCPQHSDEQRRTFTEEWIRSLDDNDFREVTGRARVYGRRLGNRNGS